MCFQSEATTAKEFCQIVLKAENDYQVSTLPLAAPDPQPALLTD